jgi:hypothetical protein
VEYAAEKAGKLEGFGANIYLRRFAAWKSLLCFEEADGIYASTIGWRKIEGVVPEGVGFNHPKTVDKTWSFLVDRVAFVEGKKKAWNGENQGIWKKFSARIRRIWCLSSLNPVYWIRLQVAALDKLFECLTSV